VNSTIVHNLAQGGAGNTGGQGEGGGVCNAGTISIDALTAIFGNKADLFPDCLGC
jgi:hypothetical protein